MPQTPEQKRAIRAARREAAGLPPAVRRSPEYWREYRRRWAREHRDVENARKARIRAVKGRQERFVSRAQPPVEIPAHQGHPILEEAVRIVGPRRSTLTTLYDPRWDDHVGAVVVALLEGRDPEAALTESRRFFCEVDRIRAATRLERFARAADIYGDPI